jgi:hypothetical protein
VWENAPDRFMTLSARLKLWWIGKLDNDSVRAWVSPYCATWLTRFEASTVRGGPGPGTRR